MRLYPFQEEAVEHLTSRRHACLADDQGLGKTISAAVAAKRLGVRNIKVIAPSVALWNWQRELAKWHGTQAVIVDSTAAAIDAWQSDSMVTSHSLVLSDDVRQKLKRADLLIVDESQFFMRKNTEHESMRSRHLFVNLVPFAHRVWMLSGTPAPNGMACELWSMLHALMPDEFSETFGAFRARYNITKTTIHGDGIKPIGNRNMAELKRRQAGFMLRRLKKNVLPDLPPRRVETISVRPAKMPPGLEELVARLKRKVRYQLNRTLPDQQAAQDAVEKHDAVVSADTPEEAFRAMRSSEDGARFRRLSGEAKVEPAVEMVNAEFANGLDCIVLFAHHTDVIEGLRKGLEKHRPVVIRGSMGARKKDAAVRQFQEGAANVAIVQHVAGGTAITLTRAAEAMFVELSYVPGDNMQCADRIYRIGQTRPVRVRFLSLAHSVDEFLTDVVRNKVAAMQELMS